MAEQRKTGIYNGTGPEQPFQMGDFLETCRQVSGSDAAFTWVPEAFLLEKEVAPWMELPMWVPSQMEGIGQGLMQVSVAAAVADGLTYRPLADTVQDTLTYADSRPEDHTWRAGLSAEKESEVLKAWHEKQD
jgi:2'-hydroxyisoflavone reductase